MYSRPGDPRPFTAFPKALTFRSEPHRRIVASLRCAHCGVFGFSQAAHPDEGKGGMAKTDDRLTFPLCCTRPGIPGCHWLIGTSGTYSRDERRELERLYSRQTIAHLVETGQWIDGMPLPDVP